MKAEWVVGYDCSEVYMLILKYRLSNLLLSLDLFVEA